MLVWKESLLYSGSQQPREKLYSCPKTTPSCWSGSKSFPKEDFQGCMCGKRGLYAKQHSQLWKSFWNWPCDSLISIILIVLIQLFCSSRISLFPFPWDKFQNCHGATYVMATVLRMPWSKHVWSVVHSNYISIKLIFKKKSFSFKASNLISLAPISEEKLHKTCSFYASLSSHCNWLAYVYIIS